MPCWFDVRRHEMPQALDGFTTSRWGILTLWWNSVILNNIRFIIEYRPLFHISFENQQVFLRRIFNISIRNKDIHIKIPRINRYFNKLLRCLHDILTALMICIVSDFKRKCWIFLGPWRLRFGYTSISIGSYRNLGFWELWFAYDLNNNT